MPFGKEFDFVLRTIRETVESFGFEYDRADESFVTETIVEKIKEQISRADLIIADLTGKTPNVFYEVGYAAALNKKLIQLAQSVADLPFDVKHLRTFAYSDKMGEDIKFKEDLARAIEDTTGYRL
jgi:nucleoside 2-deoxyribosyltransferase